MDPAVAAAEKLDAYPGDFAACLQIDNDGRNGAVMLFDRNVFALAGYPEEGGGCVPGRDAADNAVGKLARLAVTIQGAGRVISLTRYDIAFAFGKVGVLSERGPHRRQRAQEVRKE